MKYLELTYKNKKIKNLREIEQILQKEEFYWLIDSECRNSVLEIKNNTIIWKDGIFISGSWHYGIFQNGKFYGEWQNGIFENGQFHGSWISGIDLTKNNPLSHEKKENQSL
jgi:hypothetical protein